MITADPQRTPSFVMFGAPDYFFQTTGSPAIVESPAFAYNHGGIQPEITTVWVGFVGPGVDVRGVDNQTFADETDYRPTMLALLGLHDDYQHEGRVLAEEFEPWAVPNGARENEQAFLAVARAMKQLNAPLGELGKDSLKISTVALASSDPNDATYIRLEREIAGITSARDALNSRMLPILEDAEFNNRRVNPADAAILTIEADLLLGYTHLLAASVSK
jgi:hypothetical protein